MTSMMKTLRRFAPALLLLPAVPVLAVTDSTYFGVSVGGGGTIGGVFGIVLNVINYFLVPMLFAVALIVFLWGIFQFYIFEGQDKEGQVRGHQLMLWGIIGFAVMISIWGIVNVVANTFGLVSPFHQPFPRI